MRIIKIMTCCALVIVLLVVQTRFVNAQTQQNVTFPIEIKDIEMDKKSFFKGDTVKYSFTIKDLGVEEYMNETVGLNEIYNNEPLHYLDTDCVYLYWKSKGNQCVIQSFAWTEKSKKKGELRISGDIPVKEGMKQGTWYLAEIYFQYDDELTYVRDNRERIDEDDNEKLMDFSALDFQVTKTGKLDKKAPTIDLNSLKLSKAYVKKNQKSRFSIKVKDNSKVDEVVCVWDFYDKTNKSNEGDYYHFYRMKYSKKTKRYQCSVKLDARYESKAKLVAIEVRDIYGNQKSYHCLKSENSRKRNKKYVNAYQKMILRAK